MGGIPYVMMAELFPLRARANGMALANCANWGFNILVSATSLSLVNWFGIGSTFMLYAIATIVAVLFIYYFVPETRDVSLEQIEENVYAGKPMRHLGQ